MILHDTVRVISPLSVTSIFPLGKREETYQIFHGIRCEKPQADLVQIFLDVHEYQSRNVGIKAEKAAGESDHPIFTLYIKHPGSQTAENCLRAYWFETLALLPDNFMTITVFCARKFSA